MKAAVKTKIVVLSILNIVVTSALLGLIFHRQLDLGLWLICSVLIGLFSLALSLYLFSSVELSIKGLKQGLLNLKDNEFSTSLPVTKNKDEFSELFSLFNEVSEHLRLEKQDIYQRELLLDKVIQSASSAMVLTDDKDRVIYTNSAARHMLNAGKRIEGLTFSHLTQDQETSFQQAMRSERDGLFSLTQDGEIQTWHLSRGRFILNGQYHYLFLFKQLTRELNRQEVAIWKKVIRVISHELNNSLAPISSMVHSGKQLLDSQDKPELNLIFSTIDERCQHLTQFILGYARFAKLPLPNIMTHQWSGLVEHLKHQCTFRLLGKTPSTPARFDMTQIQQVLINLLKNAAESGSPPNDITLRIQNDAEGVRLEVSDRGKGMSGEVLKNALTPFYSTKRSGTGLGLSLCREIIEAHDGRIILQNRKNGGLRVVLWLPV